MSEPDLETQVRWLRDHELIPLGLPLGSGSGAAAISAASSGPTAASTSIQSVEWTLILDQMGLRSPSAGAVVTRPY